MNDNGNLMEPQKHDVHKTDTHLVCIDLGCMVVQLHGFAARWSLVLRMHV